MATPVIRLALIASLILVACSSEEAGAPTCPAGFHAVEDACIRSTGGLQGSITLRDAETSAGIAVALLGTDRVATTADDGSFLFRDLEPGTYLLSASAPGYQSARLDAVQVRAGQTAGIVSLVLEKAAAAIEGRVILADGADPVGTAVFAEGSQSVAFAGPDGTFRINEIADGTWRLVARKAGYLDARSEPITVAAGAQIQAGTLELVSEASQLGGVRGHVALQGSTEPAAGITVFLEGTSHAAVTDASGEFEIAGVAPGVAYDLGAHLEGWRQIDPVDVTIRAGEWVENVQIALARAAPEDGVLSGKVRVLGSAAATGIEVTLLAEGEELASADANEAGFYAFPPMPPGLYDLRFELAGYPAATLPNVILSAPGVTAPAALIQKAERVDARPFERLFNDGALLQLRDGEGSMLAAYDAVTGEIRDILLDADTVHFTDATTATVTVDGALVLADLQTGRLDAVDPEPAKILAQTDALLVYQDFAGDLFLLGAGQQQGTLLDDQACEDAFVDFIGALGPHPAGYGYVAYNRGCGDFGRVRVFALPVGFVSSERIAGSWADGEDVYFLAEEPPEMGRVLRRFDLVNGTMEVVTTNLFNARFGPGFSWGRIDVTGPGGYDVLSIDAATGTVTTLVEDASQLIDVPRPEALIAEVGGSLRSIDMVAGSNTLLCETPDSWFQFWFDDQIACLDGAELRLFDRAGTATLVSSAVEGGRVQAMSVYALAWHEAGTWKTVKVDDTQTVIDLGDGSLVPGYHTFDGATEMAVNSIGGTFGPRLQAIRFRDGSFRSLINPAPNTSLAGINCRLTEDGEFGACFYDVLVTDTNPTPWSCGLVPPGGHQRCIVYFDLAAGIAGKFRPQAQSGPLGFDFIPSEDGSAAYLQVANEHWVFNRVRAGLFSLRFGTSATHVALAMGPGGSRALWYDYALGTIGMTDLATLVEQTVSPTPYPSSMKLGASDTFLIDDRLVDLSTGTIVPIGSQISSRLTFGRVMTWLDGRTLKAYEQGRGLELLAENARSFGEGSWFLFLADFDGVGGRLLHLDREAGSVTELTQGISLVSSRASERWWLAQRGSDSTTREGELVLVDDQGTLVETGLRGRASTPVASLDWERIALNGSRDGEDGLFVRTADGAFVRIAPPADEIETLGEGWLFRIGDDWFLGDEDGAEPIGENVATLGQVGDGSLLFSVESGSAARVGTWRLELEAR